MSKVILGGGISGLSTAFYLSKKCQGGIHLYEASDRLGGWIKTKETGSGGYFEQGARTLRFGNAAADVTLELIEEIGLSSSVRPVGRGFKNRYFYIDNKLCNLPNSWTALFKKSSLFNEPLLMPVLRDVFGDRKKIHDESVYDFIRRRFGQRYADVLSGVICGIYAGCASEISVKSALKPLFEKEQQYGSVFIGYLLDGLKKMRTTKTQDSIQKPKANSVSKKRIVGAWSFDNGMESLPKALGDYLKRTGSVEIHLNKKCNKIEFDKGKAVLDVSGRTEVAEHLYSSLPSRELSRLIGDEHAFLRDELSKIPFVSVAVVNLEYDGSVLPMEAFGFLVPPNQKIPILGIIFDSCVYSQENKTVLTVMMGGRWFEQYLGANPDGEYVLNIAIDHVRKILNVNKKPVNHVVSILRDCIPQYIVGHNDTVGRIKDYIARNKLPLTLIGNSYNGVGIPDSILSARMEVESQQSNSNIYS